MTEPFELDGSTLEGGGQLLRLVVCLSALLPAAVDISNIRAKRSGGGGLKAQHLACVQWLAKACNARVAGAELKSKDIAFYPSRADMGGSDWQNGGDVHIEQTTPGSVNLVLQAVLPFILFTKVGKGNVGVHEGIRLKITGGTNVSNSPSCDYIEQVLVPMLALIGIPPIETRIHSRGWSQGSSGLGSVTYTITPLRQPLPAFQLRERGDVVSVRATILAPKGTEQGFRDEVDVMFERRETRIFQNARPEVEITFEDSRHEKRYYLLLVATTTTGIRLGRDWLYDRGVRVGKTDSVISNMVRKVSDDLIHELDHAGCVDEYMRDQLVVFQALAMGNSSVYGGKREEVPVEPSLHAKTAYWVARQCLGVDFGDDGGCEGYGFGDRT